MGSLMMHRCLVAALVVSLCSAAPVSDFSVLVRTPVTARHGHKTTLPCWLNPSQNAEGLEVRWFRSNFDSPIMLYREKKFENASQVPSYAGRVSFGLKDVTSGGLTAGDVSLELLNAVLTDAGDYTCYVSSEQGYDSERVKLIVTETGASPLLSTEWKEDLVNVSCESGGWYPQPNLRWLDQKQVLTPKSLKHSKDSSGLWSVHSWLLVPGSSEVSCSVGLTGEEAKEARVRLENPPQPGKQESGSSSAGWVAFALLLIGALVLAGLGVLYFKKNVKKDRRDNAEEKQKLLPKEVIQPTDLSTAEKHYVNVTPDKEGNPNLTIKDGKMRDAMGKDFPDGPKVTCLTAIKGTPGFSSGQHYWEVSLWNPNVGFKQSWWVGVTSSTVIPQDKDLTPTASNGFWFLSSSPDRAESFQLSTEPKVFLPVGSRSKTVGVYLNYDSGEISFYNVEAKSLIGSLTATFTGEVFPLFNPGKGDKATMEILQRSEQGQSSDVGNPVQRAEQSQSSDVGNPAHQTA